MDGVGTAEKSAVPRPARRVGLVLGVCVIVAGIVLFTWAGLQALQAAGFTGRGGHLTVTGCQDYSNSAGQAGGFSYKCHGDFVSSDGRFTASSVGLDGNGDYHSDGTAISGRYAGGRVHQIGIAASVIRLSGVLLGLCVIGMGAALVGACTSWRPHRRSRTTSTT